MQSSGDVAVGLFREPEPASAAITALKNAGFAAEDVSLLIPATEEPAPPTAEGADRGTRGIVAGAVLGGLSGWLAGLRALAVPYVGPFIAAGSVALGAGVGTIAGGMLGLGTQRSGLGQHTLVLVKAGGRMDEAERILRLYGALNVERARAASPGVLTGAAP
jgi:hypothetical protein